MAPEAPGGTQTAACTLQGSAAQRLRESLHRASCTRAYVLHHTQGYVAVALMWRSRSNASGKQASASTDAT